MKIKKKYNFTVGNYPLYIIHYILISVLLILFSILGCSQDAINPFLGIGSRTDVAYPTIKVEYPAASSLLPRYFTISGTAWDDMDDMEMGLDTLSITARNKAGDLIINLVIPESAMTPDKDIFRWSVNIDAIGLDDGANKFVFVLKDRAGNIVSDSRSFTIDKTGPEVKVFSPDLTSIGDNTAQICGFVNFYGFVSDSYSGVNPSNPANIFRLYSEATNKVLIEEIPVYDNGLWRLPKPPGASYDIDTQLQGFDAGVYILEILFKDKLGNPQNNVPYKWKLNLEKEDDVPSIILQNPAATTGHDYFETGGLLPISGTATDNRRIKCVEFRVTNDKSDVVFNGSGSNKNLPYTPGAIFPDATTDSFAYSTVINMKEKTTKYPDGLPDGDYQLTVYAIDEEVGRVPLNKNSLEQSRKIRLTNQAPSISVLTKETTPTGYTPLDNEFLSKDFDLSVEGLTPGLGVTYEINQPSTGFTATGNIDHEHILQGHYVYDTSASINVAGFGSGPIIVFFVAKNSTGRECRISKMYTIDKEPPLLYIDTPEIQTRRGSPSGYNGPLTISGTYTDNNRVTKIEIKRSTDTVWQTDPSWALTSRFSYPYATDAHDLETIYSLGKDDTRTVIFNIRATDVAGNTTTEDLTINIVPKTDYPLITLTDPEKVGEGIITPPSRKISGILAIAASYEDDDYPRITTGTWMTATVKIYKQGSPSTIRFQDTITNQINIIPKHVDLSGADYDGRVTSFVDLEWCTLEVTAKDWHGRESNKLTYDFQIVQSAPKITFINPSADYLFRKESIALNGTIESKSYLVSSKMTFETLNTVLANGVQVPIDGVFNINVTPEHPLADENGWMTYNFNIVLNNSGTHTGFTNNPPTSIPPSSSVLNWTGNKEWGNKQQRFRISAIDETGLEGSSVRIVYMDNNPPEIKITGDCATNITTSNRRLITNNVEVTITGVVDDYPKNGGIVYAMNRDDNIKIDMKLPNNTTVPLKAYGGNLNPQSLGTFDLSGTLPNFTLVWRPNVTNEGSYEVTFTVRDNAGTESSPVTVYFTLSANPPYMGDIIFNNNTAPKTAYSGFVRYGVTTSASSPNTIRNIYVYINDPEGAGSPKKTVAINGGTPTGATTVTNIELNTADPTLFPSDGTYTITFVADDNTSAHNRTNPKTVSIYTYNTAPSLTSFKFYTKGYINSSSSPITTGVGSPTTPIPGGTPTEPIPVGAKIPVSKYSTGLMFEMVIEDNEEVNSSLNPEIVIDALNGSGTKIGGVVWSDYGPLRRISNDKKKYTVYMDLPNEIDLYDALGGLYDTCVRLKFTITIQNKQLIRTTYTFNTPTTAPTVTIEDYKSSDYYGGPDYGTNTGATKITKKSKSDPSTPPAQTADNFPNYIRCFIDKGTPPVLNVSSKAGNGIDRVFIGPNNDDTNVDGASSVDSDRIYINLSCNGEDKYYTRKLTAQIDSGAEINIPITSTSSAFDVSFKAAKTQLTENGRIIPQLTEADHTIKFTFFAGEGIQQTVTRYIAADWTLPTIKIDSIVANVKNFVNDGNVSGTGLTNLNLSGRVVISGTYEDYPYTSRVDKSVANIRLSINGTVITTASNPPLIVNNATGVDGNGRPNPWTFTYTWDTENGSSDALITNSAPIFVTATDNAVNNQTSTTSTNKVVPYITNIVGNRTGTTEDYCYPVRTYNGSSFVNSTSEFSVNRKASDGNDTQIAIEGFNLKGSGTTTVSFTGGSISSQNKSRVVVDLGTTPITGTISLTAVGTNSIASNTGTLYVWDTKKIGSGNATNFPDFIDMDLDMSQTAGNEAIFSFCRNVKIAGYSRDYAAYRIREVVNGEALNTLTKVDPHHFSSLVYIPWTSNYTARDTTDGRGGQLFIASMTDEWDSANRYTWWAEVDKTNPDNWTTLSFADGYNGPSGNFVGRLRVDFSSANTTTYGDMEYFLNSNNVRYVYLALYDDDYRNAPKIPKIRLDVCEVGDTTPARAEGNTNSIPHSLNQITTGATLYPVANVGVVSNGNPVVSYATSDVGLYLTRLSSELAFTTTNANKATSATNRVQNSTWTPTIVDNLSSVTGERAGRDNSLVTKQYNSNTTYTYNNWVHMAYQTGDNGLRYAYIPSYNNTGNDTTIRRVDLEQSTGASGEGITGASTSIDLDSSGKPHITYLNKDKVNTKQALRYAWYTGTAITGTALGTYSNWKYMIIPSTVIVNQEKTRVRIPYNRNNVIVGYRGADYIYISRMY